MSAPILNHSGGKDLVLAVDGLAKRFGSFTALDCLSFRVARGECFGLLGPNGAGKSTTLKLVLGLALADHGQIELLSHRIPEQARAARALVGVVPQADALDPDFTVAENLVVFGRYFGLPASTLRTRLDPLLEFARLEGRRDARIDALSGGMKRRLTLARALINDPQVLFLDEPTTGLDPQARHLIWDQLKRLLAAGKTIVLTTHFMEEAERLCDRVMIIDHGRAIVEDSPLALIEREIEPHVIEIRGDGARQWAQAHAATPERIGCVRIESVGETVFAYAKDPTRAIEELSLPAGPRYLHRRANLEDVFLKLTGRDLRD